jgi:hypothetical protein
VLRTLNYGPSSVRIKTPIALLGAVAALSASALLLPTGAGAVINDGCAAADGAGNCDDSGGGGSPDGPSIGGDAGFGGIGAPSGGLDGGLGDSPSGIEPEKIYVTGTLPKEPPPPPPPPSCAAALGCSGARSPDGDGVHGAGARIPIGGPGRTRSPSKGASAEEDKKAECRERLLQVALADNGVARYWEWIQDQGWDYTYHSHILIVTLRKLREHYYRLKNEYFDNCRGVLTVDEMLEVGKEAGKRIKQSGRD